MERAEETDSEVGIEDVYIGVHKVSKVSMQPLTIRQLSDKWKN